MALDQLLIDYLVCPVDKQSLWYFDDESILYNPRTKTIYDVNEGIPVLLPNEGRAADDKEAARLAAKESSAIVTGTKPAGAAN